MSLEFKDTEDFMELAGVQKKINMRLFIWGSLCVTFASMNTMSYQFLGTTPEYHCDIDVFSKSNFTWEQLKNLSSSRLLQKEEDKISTCEMLNLNYTQFLGLSFEEASLKMEEMQNINNLSTTHCNRRVFDPSVDSFVTKWDLVCSRRPLYSSVQAAVHAGILCGSLAMGYLIDRFGRLSIYKISSILFTVTGIVSTFLPLLELYIFMKFVTTVCQTGFYISSFVLVVETCSTKHRSLVGSYYVMPWAFGMMILAGLAYVCRPWYYLQLAIYVPSVILIANYWILTESPRWLLLNGKFEECYAVLRKLAAYNDVMLPDKETVISHMEKWKEATLQKDERENENLKEKLRNFASLMSSPFKPKKIAIQTLALFFCWFTVSLVYYGVSLGATTINADQYLYMFISGALEIPSYLMLWPLAKYVGRRNSLMGLFIASGVSILAVLILLLQNIESYAWNMTLFLLGKFAIAAAFHLLYILTAELYPTAIRSLIVGQGSAFARIGSILSPFINDILYVKAPFAPSALFGSCSVLSGLLCFIFPETADLRLSETTAEQNEQRKISNAE